MKKVVKEEKEDSYVAPPPYKPPIPFPQRFMKAKIEELGISNGWVL